jgi:hypothetical protein
VKEFIGALNHTPALFYLPNSVIVLNRESKTGYTEVSNQEILEKFDCEPGDEKFYMEFLFPQEAKLRKIDYHIIPASQEAGFREEMNRFLKEVGISTHTKNCL